MNNSRSRRPLPAGDDCRLRGDTVDPVCTVERGVLESIDLLPYVGYAIPTISVYANGYVDISLFIVAFFQARQLVRCSESRQVIPLLGVKRFVDFVDQLLRGRPVITDSIQQLLRGCAIMRPAFDQFDWPQPRAIRASLARHIFPRGAKDVD